MTIPVNKVVQVNILTSPTFPARKGFGLLLIVGTSTKLPVGERIRFYSDMDGVAGDFSSTDEEYKAAQIFFSQAPRPSELAIGRRFASAAPGELLGSVSTYDASIPAWQAITNGAFKISLDGVEKSLSAMDFSGAANLNAVAAVIQAKLTLAAAGATIVFDGNRFVVKSATTGATSTVDYAVAPAAGTDISAKLGLDADGLGLKSAGVAVESISASLDALQNFDGSWYGISLTKEATEQNLKDAAAWTETRTKVLGYTTKASNVQDAGATNDIATFFKDSMYRRTFGVWDNNDDYAHVSAMGRAFSVNFNEQNSTLTLKFKVLPGITPSSISESQRQALLSKNINYYTYFGASAMLAEGVMSNGTFFDEVHGLDWLQNAIETNVFGFLYTRKTKVPQTDKGVQQIVLQVEKAMKEGVNNGLLAPGTWNGEPLGEIDTGDFLPKGFYIYAQPVAEQNQSDREARKAPPIQVLAKGAGAIHFASITVNFER
jgi:hypothetical protein